MQYKAKDSYKELDDGDSLLFSSLNKHNKLLKGEWVELDNPGGLIDHLSPKQPKKSPKKEK